MLTHKRNIDKASLSPRADAAESRIIPFVLSTFTKDRHGTVLNQDNWKLDNYRKNPVVAYQHLTSGGWFIDPNPDNIIGKDVNPHLEGIGKQKRLIGEVQFEDASINPLAEKIFRKVLFGSISRSSVGFLEVGEGRYGEGEEAKGGSEETYYFAGQELLEWSIVSIPSNPDAGKRFSIMKDQHRACMNYARSILENKLYPSQLEKMRTDDVLLLIKARDFGIKDTDPERVKETISHLKIRQRRSQMQEWREKNAGLNHTIASELVAKWIEDDTILDI